MKRKIKYILLFAILLIIGIISINIFTNDKPDKVKGIVHIWVKDNTYDYINQCANQFMKENPRVTVYVDKITTYSDLKNKLNDENQKEVRMFQASYDDLLNNDLDKYSYSNYNQKVLDIYGSNFSENVKSKYINDYKTPAIPFTSRPLALYVNSDILSEYGYKISDFNTWEDARRIGKDIYSRSGNKIKLFSGTNKNYLDLLKLILLQNISGEDDNQIKENVLNFMNELKKDNLITVNETEPYAAKISSIDGINNIVNQNNTWMIGNVPANGFGNNKFFTVDDTSIYILNNSNVELLEKFAKYIIVEDKMCINHMQNGRFFLAYLYSYKNKIVEGKINNIEGQPPLIILSNIEAKANYNKYYDKYETIIKDLE